MLAFEEMRSGIDLSLEIEEHFIFILCCSFNEKRLAANTALVGCLITVPAGEWGLWLEPLYVEEHSRT